VIILYQYRFTFGPHMEDDEDDEIAYFARKTRASFVYRTKNMR